MPRQRILTPAEQQAFDASPVLNAAQRTQYFAVSPALSELIASLRTPTNQVGFLLQLGYFRAAHRFFSRPYHPHDAAYIAHRLEVSPDAVNLASYDEATARRHRRLILEHLGYRPFDEHAQQRVTAHLRPLIRSLVRPKVLFQEAVAFLPAHKVEIPSSGTLTQLILETVRQHKQGLVERVRMTLPSESQRDMDALFEKDPAGSEDLQIQRARLTLLKRFSHSTKPSKVKENLADLQTIRALYQPLHTIIRSLDLTPDGLRYFAHAVIKSEVFQVERRADPERHLHLLCFIAHQYFHLHDLLMDVLLMVVQSTRSTCQREHQNQYFDTRAQREQNVLSLIGDVERIVCRPLARIEEIAFQERLPNNEKVRLIQDVLHQRGTERQTLQGQITGFQEDLRRESGDRGYYAVLEHKSIPLQNKVAGILQQVRFQGHDAPLLEAVRHYQEKVGEIGASAPARFLGNEEQGLLTGEKGKFRVSLYKALLFLQVADAMKSGTLHVEESYRYRSLDDYLIPRDEWQRHRQEYLEQAELASVADCGALLQDRATLLDQQYATTNRHILEGNNAHITFHKDGGFHVRTPKEEETETESLRGFFPEDRYISLLEVLATVNRHSQFLDAFQHWQVKYAKQRPPPRVFLAGILGYGCQIGPGKVARISHQISGSELERTINWYFSRDNVAEANDRILSLTDRLRLPQLYRRQEDQLHTSSDGQKIEVGVDSLHAHYSFKYFGQSKGVSAYTFLDERHFFYHSTVISSAEKEAAYVIDGVLHNDVVKSDIHSTDTGGYTEILFGVMHLLGFAFAPRIKNFAHQQRYSFRRRKEYERQGYRILPDGYIHTDLIATQWDEILRFVATIKLKVTTASQLFKRLNSYSRQHPLYIALKEFGKIEKSLFLLKWIDLVELRQAVEKQLNKGESGNRFADAICFSRSQEYQYAEKTEQEMADGCNRLIRNAIVCWNYLYLSQVLAEEPEEKRREALLMALKQGSIVLWHHLNLHGEYDFSEEKLQDSVGLDLSRILAVDVP
jgi:TnpA family transposase